MITQKVRRLMELLDYEGRSKRMMAPMLETFIRLSTSDIKDEAFCEKFKKAMQNLLNADFGELVERMVPIWEEHYSEEELDALIAFHESPVGQKLLRTLEGMRKRETEISLKWGQEQAHKYIKKLMEEEFDGE